MEQTSHNTQSREPCFCRDCGRVILFWQMSWKWKGPRGDPPLSPRPSSAAQGVATAW